MQMRQAIFLGGAAAGKTCLINTLCDKSMPEYTKTPCVDVKIHSFDNNKLLYWDTPSYDTNLNLIALKNHYHKKNDFCFVLDANAETRQQLLTIISLVNNFCKKATFEIPPRYLIITTKIDILKANRNTSEYKDFLEKETSVTFDFFLVSSLTEEGIPQLKDYLYSPFKNFKKTPILNQHIEVKSVEPIAAPTTPQPTPIIDKSTPAYKNFLELRAKVNKELSKHYIGSIWYPSVALFKLPFSVFGIGPSHMQRAKAILNIINTRTNTTEEINAILRHEEALLLGKKPTDNYAIKLINNPELSTMKNVPKNPDTSGYYESICECLDDTHLARVDLKKSQRRA